MMLRLARVPLGLLAALTLTACPQPDSVALGGECKEKVECKAPATECVLALGRKLCTVACGADDPCPDGFVCAAMELTIEGSEADAARLTATGGYCLPEAEVPPRARRIRPRKKRRRKRSRKKRSTSKAAGQDPSPPSKPAPPSEPAGSGG